MSTASKVVSVAVFAMVGLSLATAISHTQFQQKAVAVIAPQPAVELGLISKSDIEGPFGVERIWVAKLDNGQFEYRAAWPIVGVTPFGIGNGVTNIDIVSYCKKLGDNCIAAPFDKVSG